MAFNLPKDNSIADGLEAVIIRGRYNENGRFCNSKTLFSIVTIDADGNIADKLFTDMTFEEATDMIAPLIKESVDDTY